MQDATNNAGGTKRKLLYHFTDANDCYCISCAKQAGVYREYRNSIDWYAVTRSDPDCEEFVCQDCGAELTPK